MVTDSGSWIIIVLYFIQKDSQVNYPREFLIPVNENPLFFAPILIEIIVWLEINAKLYFALN